MQGLVWLDATPRFPPAETALPSPDGLLAMGGDLSPQRLLAAYRHGIFPWCGGDEPLMWWSPSRRCVIRPDAFSPARSLRQRARRPGWSVSVDRCFGAIMAACSAPRAGQDGTWIAPDFRRAYLALHRQGHAHSIEIWHHGRLAGGLYGLAIGGVFCGESMFSRETDASKLAFWALQHFLAAEGVALVDCQLENPHLLSLGAEMLPRADFLARLAAARGRPAPAWRQAESRLRAGGPLPVAGLLGAAEAA